MKIKPDFILREIGDENIVVPIGSESDRINGVISLSSTGAFLWEKLSEEQSEDSLTETLLAEYDIDEVTARNDVKQFVESISNIGCLEL